MDFPLWLKGLVAALIGGFTDAVTRLIVDPDTFDITQWKKVLVSAVVSGVVTVAAYLKASPLPANSQSQQ